MTRSEAVFEAGTLVYETEADGFLRKMVRSMVGGLIAAGRGALGAGGARARARGPRPARVAGARARPAGSRWCASTTRPVRGGARIEPPSPCPSRTCSRSCPPAPARRTCCARSTSTRLPRHVAIIMDGNGRWAQLRQKHRVEGHRAGIQAVRDTVETAARLGLEVLTLYAFSIENWKRPESEVATLMGLLKHYLRSELDTLLSNNIRFRVVGRGQELEPDVRERARARRASAPRPTPACSSTSRSTTAGAPRSSTP